MTPVTRVEIAGNSIPRFSRAAIAAFVNSSLEAMNRARASRFRVSEVSIAFVDDAEMRRLSSRFRGIRRTTDVLTFPANDSPSAGGAFLGDIVISVDEARRQARLQRHSLATEIRYLLLHGVIHAFGYDHETDSGEMNALEMKIRKRVGLE